MLVHRFTRTQCSQTNEQTARGLPGTDCAALPDCAGLPAWVQEPASLDVPPDSSTASSAACNPALLTIPEVAALLRVSTRTVSRLISSGDLPSIKIGRSVRIDREAVNQVVYDNRLFDMAILLSR